jgi:hypothetical protein
MTDLIELERRILGLFLIYNRRVRELIRTRRIVGEHFTEETHRLIWNAISSLVTSGQIANPVTVKSCFHGDLLDAVGGAQYLFRLANDAPAIDDQSALIQEWIEARPAINVDWWTWYNSYLQSDDWKVKRRKVYDRCRGLCEGCRDRPVTQVHHLTYVHVGDELLYELVGLCDDCHEKAHER